MFCDKMSKDCDMREVINAYKFYLSFENAYCNGYVTEKLSKYLMVYTIIPVVYGWADYSQVAPPHSVIDVRDFKSPKDLAKYLYA